MYIHIHIQAASWTIHTHVSQPGISDLENTHRFTFNVAHDIALSRSLMRWGPCKVIHAGYLLKPPSN